MHVKSINKANTITYMYNLTFLGCGAYVHIVLTANIISAYHWLSVTNNAKYNFSFQRYYYCNAAAINSPVMQCSLNNLPYNL